MVRQSNRSRRTQSISSRRSAASRAARSRAVSRARGRTMIVPGFTRRVGNYGRPTGELKYFDVDISEVGITSAGEIIEDSLNEIVQGTAENQRIGRKVTLRKIDMHGELQLGGSAVVNDTADTVRLILYLDTQTNGATAAVTGGDGVLADADYLSFNELSNKGRFKTLWSRIINLEPRSGTGASTSVHRQKFSVSRKLDIPLEFSSTTGAITELRSNNIGFMALARDGTNASIQAKSRIRFTDA